MERRVVVTGMGTVNPVANNLADFEKNLYAGVSGGNMITSFDTEGYSCKIAAQVKDFEGSDFFTFKDARRMDPFVQYALEAAGQALTQAGLPLDKGWVDAEKVGVIVGSGIGGIHIMESAHRILLDKGPRRVTPFLIPMLIANMAAGQISISFGCKGYNTCVVTACASATHAIGQAYHVIKRGDCDIVISGGAESSITPLGYAGFATMRAMSTRNDDPEHASRPFDKARDGFLIGEGSGILVLEDLESAKARGATILAELAGYGASADAMHITAPDIEGQARAMKMALKWAGIQPEDIDYVNAHGTSTPLNDAAETQAFKLVYGDHAYKMAISSTKSIVGHLLGAAGGVEAIATIFALINQKAHATINYETPDPDCDLDYIPNEPREMEIEYAASDGFGFGGQNACIVLKRYDG
ncbi:MAG: beta-ketoacyl-ACP synthase II [bacterium]|nr:beta-ketoacyl-ACP synthase II [bacterium]